MTTFGGLGGFPGGRALDTDDHFEMAVYRSMGDAMKDDESLCREVWSALANMEWVHENGDSAAYTFRAAGDLIAAVIGRGDYMQWYCSGPYAEVSERVATALAAEGWKPAKDAVTAGLWGKPGPWKQYPDRMLQMRARGLAARDGAADVLSGIYLAEEMQDVEQPSSPGDLMDAPRNSGRRKSSSQAKKDGDDVAFNELRGAISGCDTVEELDTLVDKNVDILDELPIWWSKIIESEITDKRSELTEAANG